MKNFKMYILLSVFFIGTGFVYAQDIPTLEMPQSLKCYSSNADESCQTFDSTQSALHFVYEATGAGVLTVAVGQQDAEQNQPNQDIADIVLEFYDSNGNVRQTIDTDYVGQEIAFFKVPQPGTYYAVIKSWGNEELPAYLEINSSWTPYPSLIPNSNDSRNLVGPDGNFLPIVVAQDLSIGTFVDGNLNSDSPLDVWVTQLDLDPNFDHLIWAEAETSDIDISLRAYEKFNPESLQSVDKIIRGTESLTYTPTGQGPISIYLQVLLLTDLVNIDVSDVDDLSSVDLSSINLPKLFGEYKLRVRHAKMPR